MKIGISKPNSKFNFYENWLKHFGVNYEVLDYNKPDEGFKKFESCSGLILTGGVDICPDIYCDWSTSEDKGKYIPQRDGFEMKLIEKSLDRKIPVFAICRGSQLMNVFFRGSLIFDLEEIREVNHDRLELTVDRIHEVNVFENTLLREVTRVERGEVNSSHHQAIDRLGEGLMVSAKSDDGVVEGIEYTKKNDKPFFIGVQWHPERFNDFNSPFTKNILEKFLDEAK